MTTTITTINILQKPPRRNNPGVLPEPEVYVQVSTEVCWLYENTKSHIALHEYHCRISIEYSSAPANLIIFEASYYS